MCGWLGSRCWVAEVPVYLPDRDNPHRVTAKQTHSAYATFTRGLMLDTYGMIDLYIAQTDSRAQILINKHIFLSRNAPYRQGVRLTHSPTHSLTHSLTYPCLLAPCIPSGTQPYPTGTRQNFSAVTADAPPFTSSPPFHESTHRRKRSTDNFGSLQSLVCLYR